MKQQLVAVRTFAFLPFQSLQLFTSVVMESAGIDYHVMLAANALQQCLDIPELQPELLCALMKQTSRVRVASTASAAQQSLCAPSLGAVDGGSGGGGGHVQVNAAGPHSSSESSHSAAQHVKQTIKKHHPRVSYWEA